MLVLYYRKTNNRQHEFEVEQVFKSDKKRYIESACKQIVHMLQYMNMLYI